MRYCRVTKEKSILIGKHYILVDSTEYVHPLGECLRKSSSGVYFKGDSIWGWGDPPSALLHPKRKLILISPENKEEATTKYGPMLLSRFRIEYNFLNNI